MRSPLKTIEVMPKRSTSVPKLLTKKVLPIGMVIRPPSDPLPDL